MTSAPTHPAQTDATADGSRAGTGASDVTPSSVTASDAAASGVAGAGTGTPQGPGGNDKHRGLAARIWAAVWRGLVFLLLLLLFFLAGVLLALRNENVQAWIKDEVNAVLAASAEKSGLHIRLTSLSGALPFRVQAGVELADAYGLWLEAPQNTFVWDWAALPGRMRIAELTSNGARLLRLPELPPSAPEPPSPPLTEASLREMLGETVRTISALPGWLPDVLLDRVAVVDAQLPASLLGALPPAGTTANVRTDAKADAKPDASADAKPDVSANASADASANTPAKTPTNTLAAGSGNSAAEGQNAGAAEHGAAKSAARQDMSGAPAPGTPNAAGTAATAVIPDATSTPDVAKGEASPTAALPAASLPDASLPDASLRTDSYFLANVAASLKAGSTGGNLTVLLTAHGVNDAPLPLTGVPSGGLEARLEMNFTPRRSGTVSPSTLALTVDSTLEATVLPAGHAGDAARTAPSAGADAQAGQATSASTATVPTPAATSATASSTPATANTASGTAATPPTPATAVTTAAPAQGVDNTSANAASGPLATLLGGGARISLALGAEVEAPEKPGAPGSPEAMATVARVGLNKFSIQAGPLSTAGHAFWQSTPAAPAGGAVQHGAVSRAASPLAKPAQAGTPSTAPAQTATPQAPSSQAATTQQSTPPQAATAQQAASPQDAPSQTAALQSAPTQAVPSHAAPLQTAPSQKTSPQGSSWLSGPLDVDLQISIAPSKSTPATAAQAAVQPPAQTAAQAATTKESADPLDMLAAPATVRLTAAGPLAAPDLTLRVECADLRMGTHKLEQAVVHLGAAPLNWQEALMVVQDHKQDIAAPNAAPTAPAAAPTKAPDAAPGESTAQRADAAPNKTATQAEDAPPKAASAKRPELTVQLDVSGRWDGQPLSLESQIFAGRGEEDMLQAGLRNLRLNALGLAAAGQVTASLPPGSMPACDGKIDVRVADWAALSTLVPGARLDGEAALSLELRADRVAVTTAASNTAAPNDQNGHSAVQAAKPSQSASENPPATPAVSGSPAAPASATAEPAQRYSQKAELRFNVPRLSYSAGASAPLTLRNLAGELALKDVFGPGSLAARIDLGNVRQGDLSLGVKVRANGALSGPLDASVETSGSVAANVNARWQPGLVQVQRLEAHVSGRDLGFRAAPGAALRYGDAGLDLKGLDIRLVPGGRLRAQAFLGQNKMDVRLDLEGLALTPWKKFVPALPEGTVEAQARLTGSPSQPGGNFRLGVRQLRIPSSPLKPLNVGLTGRIEASGGSSGSLVARLDMDKESVQALGGSEARLEVRLPLLFGKDGLPQPNMQGPLRGQVRWKGAAGPLWSLLPIADQRFAGNVAVNVDLDGTLAAPSAKGAVLVDKGKYENLLQGVLLTNINLRLNLEEGRGGGSGKKQGGLPGVARLELDASGGLGGKLRVAGFASLDGSRLDIKTTIDHLRPLSRRDIRIELSGEAGVTGSAAAPQVAGKIIVNQGLILLNKLAVGGSVTTLPITEAPDPSQVAQQAAAEKPAAQGSLNLNIVIPGRFFVEGHGLTSEWKADLLVTGTPEDPQITGQITAVKGTFDFLTKVFKLSRGTITFAGGALSNPLLDIKLSNETPNLTSYVTISGTVRKMKLTLSSEPEMPRDEILAQILFGKSTNELGRLENLRLAGAVAQLAGFGSGGGGIFDLTRKALGVDVLRLNSTPGTASGGQSEDEGMGAGTSVEMGKYITDIIYVGVQQGMKQGSTAFIIQLEITPRTSLELRSEQQSTWGGIRWKYNY
ncbi:MAG: hypothetical protein BCS36_12420 [Desulfovibrio sp. MES5]|uniref:translocation/assembly module TamB domain-containing protein n=1 Tax=Desulfovibrio sp. MES5 TaxID=1899016 RepID=UPI000B9CE441|nr:translocation/assembly module TamB domain-containing protein [Desulfovibrio sp. MES5]OXS29262.1 MAG: hypothetical protein BCS36_12420 [Desulfovibrio sp. MES5]